MNWDSTGRLGTGEQRGHDDCRMAHSTMIARDAQVARLFHWTSVPSARSGSATAVVRVVPERFRESER